MKLITVLKLISKELFLGILDNTKFLLLVCEMFFIKKMSQKEISTALKISRSQVCRIIAQAEETGLVTHNINYPNTDENFYQLEIQKKYAISEVYVYDTGESTDDSSIRKLAELTKDLFSVIVRDNDTVGVMAGKTIAALARALPKSNIRGLEFIPLCGGASSNGNDWYANTIAQELAGKTGGKYYLLNAPQYLNNLDGKKVLMNEPSIKKILDMGKGCNVVLIGIGNVDSASTTIEAGHFLLDDIDHLKKAGAVASICASYINADGNVIDSEMTERIIGLSIKDLEKAKKIGIACGLNKVDAIKAILEGGYLDVLITSLSTARCLI